MQREHAPLSNQVNSRMSQAARLVTPIAAILAPAAGQQDCGNCYHLNTATLVGIIVGDIVLTVLMALSVFCFVSHLKKRNHLEALEGKGKIQASSKNKITDQTESPYQELQGVQNDVYSDLRKFRNN